MSGGAVLFFWFALTGQPPEDGASRAAPSPEPEAAVPANSAELTGVVQRYCVVCHNERLRTGNLTLRDFAVDAAHEQAETAEKMIRKLRAGMMPPAGRPRPDQTAHDRLLAWLEGELDRAAANSAARCARLAESFVQHRAQARCSGSTTRSSAK